MLNSIRAYLSVPSVVKFSKSVRRLKPIGSPQDCGMYCRTPSGSKNVMGNLAFMVGIKESK